MEVRALLFRQRSRVAVRPLRAGDLRGARDRAHGGAGRSGSAGRDSARLLARQRSRGACVWLVGVSDRKRGRRRVGPLKRRSPALGKHAGQQDRYEVAKGRVARVGAFGGHPPCGVAFAFFFSDAFANAVRCASAKRVVIRKADFAERLPEVREEKERALRAARWTVGERTNAAAARVLGGRLCESQHYTERCASTRVRTGIRFGAVVGVAIVALAVVTATAGLLLSCAATRTRTSAFAAVYAASGNAPDAGGPSGLAGGGGGSGAIRARRRGDRALARAA